MKITDLLQIGNIDNYNFNDKTKYVWYQILGLIGLIVELRIGLIFQYTKLQLSMFASRIQFLSHIYKTSLPWLISDILTSKCGFCVFS